MLFPFTFLGVLGEPAMNITPPVIANLTEYSIGVTLGTWSGGGTSGGSGFIWYVNGIPLPSAGEVIFVQAGDVVTLIETFVSPFGNTSQNSNSIIIPGVPANVGDEFGYVTARINGHLGDTHNNALTIEQGYVTTGVSGSYV